MEGVSTRKVNDITEELCGITFSKSLISSLAGRLDAELAAWRSRPLEAAGYPVREPNGFREILAVEVADTESEATYQDLFRSLKARGLRGVELVVSDDHRGLKAVIERHFQWAYWQRCQVHYARNPPRHGGGQEAQGTRCGVARDSSLPRAGSKLSGSLRRLPIGGEVRVARRLPASSKSTSRSASLAWPSRSSTAGASAPPTASRDSTRS